MPVSIAALLVLTAALWMVLNPEWWIAGLQSLPQHVEAVARAISPGRWPSPLDPFSGPSPLPRNDRRTRTAIRLTGALLALVAAMLLYEQALRMLLG